MRGWACRAPWRNLGVPCRTLPHLAATLASLGTAGVEVLNMTVCLTHLNPHDVRRRLDEARAIARRTLPLPLPLPPPSPSP